VQTDQLFVPSTMTHEWTESGGIFALGPALTNPEINEHFSRAAVLLGELGYSGDSNAFDMEAYLNAEIDAAVTIDDLKPIVKKTVSAALHLIVAVSEGWKPDR